MPRIHGNVGKKPKHALSFETVSAVVQFLDTYTECYGLRRPADEQEHHQLTHRRHQHVPLSTKHKCHVASLSESGIKPVGYHSFRSITRLDCLPYIQIMTPHTDDTTY